MATKKRVLGVNLKFDLQSGSLRIYKPKLKNIQVSFVLRILVSQTATSADGLRGKIQLDSEAEATNKRNE